MVDAKKKRAALAALLAALLGAACASAPEDCRPKPGEPVPSTLICSGAQPRGGT